MLTVNQIFEEANSMMDVLNKPVAVTSDEKRSNTLTTQAKVYAARMRLQESMDQADGLDAIREIVGNLMGSEEVALYKIDRDKASLWLYWSFGIDPNAYAVLDIIGEPKLERALTGKTVLRGDLGNDKLLRNIDSVSAIVPVLVDGVAEAVLVIFRLLPQKLGIDAADVEICRVLSNCAARAIWPNRL
jgi:hypothetical protein